MSTLADVLVEHGVHGMSAGTHSACRCDRKWVAHAEYRTHLAAVITLALHPKTCEINGDKGCEHGDACPVLVCGPCGEAWPCPTVKALLGA